jgi:Protein of unknown function (DUF3140)
MIPCRYQHGRSEQWPRSSDKVTRWSGTPRRASARHGQEEAHLENRGRRAEKSTPPRTTRASSSRATAGANPKATSLAKIVGIIRKKKSDYTDDDIDHMKKVTG